MERSKFTKEQRDMLIKNPNVADVSEEQISYTNDFKIRFVERYLAGEKAVSIFESAGLPKSLIGRKRIEKAKERWLASYENGTLGQQKALTPTGSTKIERMKTQIEELQGIVGRQKMIIHGLREQLKKQNKKK